MEIRAAAIEPLEVEVAMITGDDIQRLAMQDFSDWCSQERNQGLEAIEQVEKYARECGSGAWLVGQGYKQESENKMDKFARLEEHDGHQVLATIGAGESEDGTQYGPCVNLRCDPSITVEVRHGPWPDTKAGWDAAFARFESLDLEEFLKSAVKMMGDILDTPEGSAWKVASARLVSPA